MTTYHVGSLITGAHPYPIEWPRPLIDDAGDTVAIVDCCAGPAVVGDLTEDQADEQFSTRLDQIGDWT